MSCRIWDAVLVHDREALDSQLQLRPPPRRHLGVAVERSIVGFGSCAGSEIWALWSTSPAVVRHLTGEGLPRVQKPPRRDSWHPHCSCRTTSDLSSTASSRGRHGRSSLRAVSKRQYAKDTSHLLSNAFSRSLPAQLRRPLLEAAAEEEEARDQRDDFTTTSVHTACSLWTVRDGRDYGNVDL